MSGRTHWRAERRPTERRAVELLDHMQFHRVKQWLLDGARREHAHTIGRAVRQMPEHRLIRRLARVLARG